MTTTKITFEEIKDLLPTRTSLYYVDKNNSLDGHTKLIQKCIDNKNCDALYEAIDEWYQDSPFYAFKYLDKELISDICNKFEIEEDEADYISDETGFCVNSFSFEIL